MVVITSVSRFAAGLASALLTARVLGRVDAALAGAGLFTATVLVEREAGFAGATPGISIIPWHLGHRTFLPAISSLS